MVVLVWSHFRTARFSSKSIGDHQYANCRNYYKKMAWGFLNYLAGVGLV